MLTYQIEKTKGKSKYEALYLAIKADIQNGVLRQGEKLPSKRNLAAHLGVSVITVENAYNRLMEEGYLESRERSGYYVAAADTLFFPKTEAHPIVSDEPVKHTDAPLPKGFLRVMRKCISEYAAAYSEIPDNKGSHRLREALCEYLLRYRGISVKAENIMIGSGSEDLYGRIALLLGTDKIFGIEDPSYRKIQTVYANSGIRTVPMQLGEEGILSGELEKKAVDVLHITPFDSYPTGITASSSKRREYLLWVNEGGRYLIEDDFHSEFAVGKKPLETLFAMNGAKDGRVIYMNTFSKSIAPSVRTGYMILPDVLLEEYQKKFSFYSCPVNLYTQMVLAEYLRDGFFERHLNRCRRNRD